MLTPRWSSRASSGLRRWAGARSGVAAVEFALLCPALVLLLGGVVELGGAISAGNRATRVADTIGLLVSQAENKLTVGEVDALLRSAALVDTDIGTYARQKGKSVETAANVTVTSVTFAKSEASCTVNCTYTGKTQFSHAIAGPVHACGPVSTDAVPAALVKEGGLIITEVEVFYRPMMTTILGKEISFKRATYFNARFAARIEMEGGCS